MLLIIISLVNPLVNALNIKISKNLSAENIEIDSFFIQLTKDQFTKINNYLDNIIDLNLKNEARNILNQIITSDSKLDLKAFHNLSKHYFDVLSNIILTEENVTNICKICKPPETNTSFLPVGKSVGTSTIFEPPYSDCYSWGKGVNWIDEYSHGCNKYSGAIGAYTKAFIGGATAEAMQKLHFYVGRTKTVYINAKIIRTGGKSTFGLSAFAGTEKTWSWDDFKNNYHRADVDPWWSWEDIILKIIDLVTFIIGFAPKSILEAIILLNNVFDFIELFNHMNNLLENENAEILNISFSFSASSGYHTIWVGLRATTSAFLAGFASAVTMGQVTNITIDGIAAPNSPILSGPSTATINDNLDFCAHCYDPNSDKIRYFFDWGDGTNSGWTDYLPSGSNVYKSHIYEKKGTYELKVIVEDIDRMKSCCVKEIYITKPRFLSNNKIFNQALIQKLILALKSRF